MSILTQASHEWATRPADERFLNLIDLRDAARNQRQNSATKIINVHDLEVRPVDGDHRALVVVGPNGSPVAPNNWAFGQICQKAGAPASYLRDLPGELAADNLNYSLKFQTENDEIKVLIQKTEGNDPNSLTAVTGKGYGRVWNETIAARLVEMFGDGRTGNWKVPGEFGKQVPITKDNTTLYAGDRDMFVFLADEEHRVTVKNRRDGQSGSLATGFFVWNSQVGSRSFGVAKFLFDYACSNRIVWGVNGYTEIKVRHTSGAPQRWIDEVAPEIQKYAQENTSGVSSVIASAQTKKIDDIEEFLSKRFTKSQVGGIRAAFMADEQRPIETIWDAVTGATAFARGIEWQDQRVKIEQEAGKILQLAA